MDCFRISVVVPIYNEEESLRECNNRLLNVLDNIQSDYEIIYVNDGSKDTSLTILKELAKNNEKIKVLSFSRNFGHQVAVSAGIEHSKGDCVVLIDGDLQDPPELISDMISKWNEGFDVVYGKRSKRNGETWFKKISAKMFYRTINQVSDIDIPKDTGDFRLMDRRVVDAFLKMPEKNRFIRGMVSWVGFNQVAIEYERDKRYAGITKYPIKKMINFAKDGIVSFSKKPLKFITQAGLCFISLSIIMLMTMSIVIGFKGYEWLLIINSIMFFSGIQMFSLGIIGEYIGRIYDEAKDRPLYIVKDSINIE